MNIEQRIKDIETQLKWLQQTVEQMGKNNVSQTEKVDDTANKVVQITPYTDSKTAYIGDSYVAFTDVPQGKLSVFGLSEYDIYREGGRVAISFPEVEEVTEISIMIQ